MIIKKEKKNNILIYYLNKNINDKDMEKLNNTFVEKNQINLIINEDTNVYKENGELLLLFRKNVLSNKNINLFYDNVYEFANLTTTNRGSTSGSNNKNIKYNPKIKSNVIGYIDKFSPKQKQIIKEKKLNLDFNVRPTRFIIDFPDKYKNLIPLIREIDKKYKKYLPKLYLEQNKKAKQTNFKIDDTSFSTITTNVNFQTSIHKDKGDDPNGFGNLCIIEKGKYIGGEICFPQYGIGVDIRNNDLLLMDVHEYHGNLPIKLLDKKSLRLSIVCYLRLNVWKNSKNITKKQMKKQINILKSLRKNKTIKNKN